MKTIKLLLAAVLIQFSFGSIAQTNHILIFTTENQEINLQLIEHDTITVINEYLVGDYHYGYPGSGVTILENNFNVQIGDTICKIAVTFHDTISSFYVFYGSNPGVPFGVNLIKQYLDVKTLISDYKFSIYPNPTSDILNIDTESSEEVKIYNLTGQLVLTASSQSKKIDISALNAGTYLVQIGLHSKRLVIE